MPPKIDRSTENLVFPLSTPGYGSITIQKMMKSRGIKISRPTINSILKGRGKRREAELKGKLYKKYQPSSKLTPQVLKRIDTLTSQENPKQHRVIANRLSISKSTVFRGIHVNLKKRKVSKKKVHVLTQADMKNRKMNCIKFTRIILQVKSVDLSSLWMNLG